MPDGKVLFVVPALRRAGAECQLVTLVNGLSGDQFEKHLLSYRSGDDLNQDVDTDNVMLHRLQRRHKLDLKLGRAIAEIIDEHEIDIVHCTLMNALVFGLLGRLFAKRKPAVITVIHTTKNVDLKHDLADALLHRQLLKRCREIWFVSTRQSDQWIERMPFINGRHRVIHNGVDTTRFDSRLFADAARSFRESLGIGQEEKVISCVAGLRPEKLHSVLIKAFQIVRRNGIACRLLLAGEGSMEQPLRSLVKELQLEESVDFLGALSDVRPLLAISDCKVLPSAAETFSMAMLESMAMGVPVISTEVGGASEAIEDGVSGALVPAGDVEALADWVTDVLSDDALRTRMGASARETVVEKFRQESMIEKSAACLRQVLQHK